MTVTHEFELRAVCPVDSYEDLYAVTLRIERLVQCEEVLKAARGVAGKGEVYQEELTQKLADTLGGEVTTKGFHRCGVTTTVTCQPQGAA